MGVEEPIKKIRGDGLSLKIHSNEQILEIIGDGCNVIMKKNSGNVRIIGDGCCLKIDQNLGTVEYIGDGGQVFLGSKSLNNKVKYVGDGGEVSCNRDARTSSTKIRKPEQTSKVQADEYEKPNIKKHSTSVEQTENILNMKKECKKSREKVVKVVTTFSYDDKIVNRWFVNPVSVVRSFDGASFVKVPSKEANSKRKVK